MAGVFREIEIAYQGETYFITPSVRMLRRIEGDGDINLLGVIHKVGTQAESGALPIFDLATIACGFLREAGAKVSEDDVYGEMMHDLSHNEARWIISFCETLVTAISPPEDAAGPKLPAAPAAKPKRTQKSK
jgi:hypothetical protein